MIVVIFEVWPKPGREDEYRALAGELRAQLEGIDGFVSVERFRSLSAPDKLLSLSVWRDAEAVERWWRHAGHRLAQEEGRERLFQDFRIRVADVLRDYDLAAGRPVATTAPP
jgi:heme-degrading monooxygenase HmoA